MGKKRLILAVVGYGTLLLTLGLFAFIGYWSFCPYKTIDFKGDYIFDKSEYRQGEVAYYTVKFCKYSEAPVTVNKQYIDGLIFTVDSPRAVLAQGCHTTKVPITIPDTLPTGKYQLKVTASYKVNPIRIITKVNYSNWFTVKE